jgi:selenocysteine lyase/cysteine desulfurase
VRLVAGLHAALTAAGVDVAVRGGSLRASPHLYNTAGDIDRLLGVVSDGRP